MVPNTLRLAVLMMTMVLLTAGCDGGGGGSSGKKPSPDRAASPLVLEAASLEYGAALTWNQELFQGAAFTLCYAEEQTAINNAEATPEECFFYENAMIINDSASPMTLTELDGGQRYWMQLEAVMPSGETIYSGAIRVTPSISDEALLGETNLAISWNDIQYDSGNIDKVKALRTDPEGLIVFIGKKNLLVQKKE